MKTVALVSGGKDSTAMALRLWELKHKFTIVSVFTEFEFPAVKQQVYKLIKLTNLPYKIYKVEKGTWNKWFYGKIKRGKLKGKVRGMRILNKGLPFCWYKREAKYKIFKKLNQQYDLLYIGIKYDEKHRAKNNPKFKYPLIEWKWTQKEVTAYLKQKDFWIREYDLFPHTGCFLCPYQSEKAWLKLKTNYPKLFKTAMKYHLDNLKLTGVPLIPDSVVNQEPISQIKKSM